MEIRSRDLPEPLIARISNIIHSYSSPLLQLRIGRGGAEEQIQIGSGTFISIDGTRGILTAYHVRRLIERGSSLGMPLISQEHTFFIPQNHLRFVDIAMPVSNEAGPDLSFISIPSHSASAIDAIKSFFDLSVDRNYLLDESPDPHSAIWFVCGAPQEYTAEEPSDLGMGMIPAYNSLCFLVEPNRMYETGGFDYIEADVEYTSYDPPPRTFGGISGGGLWQVQLRGTNLNALEPSRYMLSGVAFYESELDNQRRYIKCHGVRSVFQVAYEAIVSECS